MASFQSAKLLRIDLGDEQLKALERLAARQGRSVEEFINDALRRYLSREATRLIISSEPFRISKHSPL